MLAHTRELLEELEEGGGDGGRDSELPLEDKLLPKVEEVSEQQHEMETTWFCVDLILCTVFKAHSTHFNETLFHVCKQHQLHSVIIIIKKWHLL